MTPVQKTSITSLLQAFRIYLTSLGLSAVSRKLYLGDLKHFLSQLEESLLSLSHLEMPDIYLSYLELPEVKSSASLTRRYLASLRQFGNFLAATYNVTNPTASLTLVSKPAVYPLQTVISNYIKSYLEYLNTQHLSFSTIKSYKSDVTQYLTHLANSSPSTNISELLNEKNIKKYLSHLSESNNGSDATLTRKEKSLARFVSWLRSTQPQIQLSDKSRFVPLTNPTLLLPANSTYSLPQSLQPLSDQFVSPEKKSYFVKNNIYRIFSFSVLLLFLSTLAIFSYRQLGINAKLTQAVFPDTPTTPNRQLSFQGRLENASGTPIEDLTPMTFKLYNSAGTGNPPTGGTELYSTGSCNIDPDADGIFSTQIGSTCGASITSTVFTENSNVWLEVTVNGQVLGPRQQIATVAYALNSETLQGFPISSTISAIRNTVVPMNQWGEVILGEQSPRLTGVSGTLAISAPSLTLSTATGTNGNITLAPDGTGQVNVQGNTTTTNFFNISNAQLSTGSLITGTVANNNTGFKLIDLLSGSSPTSKFSVTDAGNTTIAGDLTISGDDLYMGTNTAGMLLIADGTNFNPTTVSGDITINGSGITSIGADKITENMLKSVNVATDEYCLSYESTVGDFEWQTCGSDIADDSLDFDKFQDTLDLDANLILNQGSNTWVQNFTGTTTDGLTYNANSLTSGDAININSTSTTLTTGSLLGLDWSPGSATTATGDLFSLNIGANGTTNNILNVKDSGSSLFSISETAMTSNLPASFTSPGDVAIAYDLNFTNPTASYVKSAAPLYLQAGETFNNSDLTLQTYNKGNVVINTEALSVAGSATISGNLRANSTTTFGGQTYTWPGTQTPNYVLQTNGSGTLSWVAQTGGGSGSFTDITSGTNTTAAMVVGNGASLNFSGTGTINASSLLGSTWAIPGAIGSTTPNTGVFTNLTSNANTILGDAVTDTITFNGRIAQDSDLIPIGTTGTNDLGSSSLPWDNLFANSITLPTFTAGSIIFTGPSGILAQDNSNFFWNDTTNRLGIGTISSLATLDVRGTLGTIPVASFSGTTSQAAVIVNQDGIGDIFTASKSGATKFVINNAGNVGIGVSSPTNRLEIGGSTSTISNGSGDITIDSASNNVSFAGDSLINILNGYFGGELGVGISDATSKLHVHGATVGKALSIFNELGDQAIFTASSSGATKFTIANAGNITTAGTYLNFGLTDGTSGYGFRDNAGVLEFKNSSGTWKNFGSASDNWWNQTSGTIQPYNTTVDLLVGGNATSSAKFGLINVNSGTPTATISGSTAGNALYLTGDGVLATSNNRTLQINPNGGNVGIGVANPSEKLEVNGYIVGQRFVDSAGGGAYYLDPAGTSTSLSISGDIVSDNSSFTISSTSNQNITIDAGSGTVNIGASGAGKLDAGTIDPPYTINGQKFATYMASMTGVKEETTGVVSTLLVEPGLYRATLDLKNAPVGSDLWLFRRVTNLPQNLDQLVVLLSTSSPQSWYTIDAENGQIHLYTKTPARVSYRLTAPRYDADQWANARGTDSSSIGHVIDEADVWDTTNLNLRQVVDPSLLADQLSSPTLSTPTLETNILSPLAIGSAITATAPIVINPNSVTDLPALTVNGEIEATTISARSMQLDTLEVKNIIADRISVNQIEGLEATIATLSAGTTTVLSDSELETITDKIKARLDNLLNPETAQDLAIPPEATSSTNVATPDLNPTTVIATDSAYLTSLDTDLAIINNYLAVIGSATITSLDITNHLYTASIESKTGILNLGSNTLIVDSTTGQVLVNGDLVVTGTVLADKANVNELTIGTPATSSALANLLSVYNEKGESVATIDASGSANLADLTTNMITIASAKDATGSGSSSLAELLGTTKSNATAGESILLSPNTELTIESNYVTSDSLVYLTPTTNTDNKVLFVKSKNTCTSLEENCTPSFTVGIDLPASSDISFNWWIIRLAPPPSKDNL